MKKSSKIKIFYGGFKKKSGGAFLHAKTLNEKFNELGFKSDLITLDNLPTLLKFFPHIIFYICLKFSPSYAFILKGQIIGFLFKKFYNSTSDYFIFEDIYIPWKRSHQVMVILHAVWSDNLQSFNLSNKHIKKLKRLEEFRLRDLTGRVYTVSIPYRNYLVNNHFAGLKLSDIGVIPLGRDIPSNLETYFAREKRSKSIVTVGLLEKRKNLHLMLRVLKELVSFDSTFCLTIIGGDGGELEGLRAYVEQNRLPVVFKGRMEYEAALLEISHHELYLHTSVKESFSYSLLEAKLLGLKTIAFKHLEVPPEFIDVKVNDFDVMTWVCAIKGADSIDRIEVGDYSTSRLATETIRVLGETDLQ